MAVNRIYYAIYYVLSALALKHHFVTSKHAQLIGWFNKNFIKEEIIDRKYGKYIHIAFEKRMKGDYDVLTEFSKEDVIDLFEKIKEAVDEIEKLI